MTHYERWSHFTESDQGKVSAKLARDIFQPFFFVGCEEGNFLSQNSTKQKDLWHTSGRGVRTRDGTNRNIVTAVRIASAASVHCPHCVCICCTLLCPRPHCTANAKFYPQQQWRFAPHYLKLCASHNIFSACKICQLIWQCLFCRVMSILPH